MAVMSGGRGSMPQYLSQRVPNGLDESWLVARCRHAARGGEWLRMLAVCIYGAAAGEPLRWCLCTGDEGRVTTQRRG
jgi:hypothetical protein